MSISLDSAVAWVIDKSINPDTKKKITVNGPKYKEFLQAAKDYGILLSVKVFKKTFSKRKDGQLDEVSKLMMKNRLYIMEDGLEYTPHMMWWSGQKYLQKENGCDKMVEGFLIGFQLDPITGKITVVYEDKACELRRDQWPRRLRENLGPDGCPNVKAAETENYWKPIATQLAQLLEQVHVKDS
jgi:hypothetical protein